MPTPFDLPYVQRALVEVVLLAVGAGVLGTWVVLRGWSFFAHAVGTAAFPGLVLAEGLGFSALLGALTTAGVVAIAVARLTRRGRAGHDTATALVLVGALAGGVILASDVFHSQGSVERLLFGSLLLVNGRDELFAAGIAVAVLAVGAPLGRRWLATGFDAEGARALGARSAVPDGVLLALIAAAAIAALDAIGALLATALLVIPAATTRLVLDRLLPWQLATVALLLVEGTVGVWLSVEVNAPPGATIAVITAAVFALVALWVGVRRWRLGRSALTVGGVILALAAVGCGSSQSGGDGAPGAIEVVATTTELGDIVREVGGSAVRVTQILQPNSDPHDYEPRPRDILETAGADVVFLSGDGLDGWMGSVVENAGGDPRIVDVGAGRPVTRPGESSGPEASRWDPHWWHEPRNVEYAVGRIRAALVAANPSAAKRIDRRARAYVGELRRLDRSIRACMARVPAGRRKLVTDHDAFGYFAARYDIEVIGAVIPSQTSQAQASAGDIAALSRLIEREHVRAVFPESSLSARLAHAIARQTGASAGPTLYGDTLGPAGSAGATYATMEAANADAMVRGFTGGRDRCRVGGR